MSVFIKVTYILLIASICLLSGCNHVNQDSADSISGQKSVNINVTDEAKPTEPITATQGIERTDESKIRDAISLIKDKKYPQAIGLLSQIKNNEYAEDLLKQLRYIISGTYIANLNAGVAAIDNEGKIKIVIDDTIYKYYEYDEVADWNDIKQFSFAQDRLDALDSEGVIHSTKDTDPSYEYVRDQLKSYTDLEIISTDFDNYALLSRSGIIYTYSAKFSDSLDAFQDYISTWKDIVDVVTGQMRVAALKNDGTVLVADYAKYANPAYGNLYDEIADWNNIVAISADTTDSIAGLKSDGTVVISTSNIAGSTNSYSYDVSSWNDIIAISKSSTTLLGLRRDGTVVATGDNGHNQLEVSDWTDIVAIAAGNWISIGLKSDGTIIIAGETEEGVNPPDVSLVKNLYVPTIIY